MACLTGISPWRRVCPLTLAIHLSITCSRCEQRGIQFAEDCAVHDNSSKLQDSQNAIKTSLGLTSSIYNDDIMNLYLKLMMTTVA